MMPSYPEKALRYSRVGYVVVEYNINTNGEVVSPKVVDAMPEGYLMMQRLLLLNNGNMSPISVVSCPTWL